MSILGCAAFFAATLAGAQSPAITDSSSNAASSAPSGWSSSQANLAEVASAADPALPSAPAPAGALEPRQESGGAYSGWHGHGLTSRLTFELGGGFNAPVGNDTPYITWGGNFTLGAGVRFSQRVSALLEYQFIDNKLPGAFIAAQGVDAGDAHINAITGSPVIDLTPKWSNGVYVVGGWGYYHKSTNLNDYECCEYDYYGGEYEVPITVASITSNQWGGNVGLGIYHRLRGFYGEGKTQIFAESRYTFLHTPRITETNGLGTTGLIPVTLGVRF